MDATEINALVKTINQSAQAAWTDAENAQWEQLRAKTNAGQAPGDVMNAMSTMQASHVDRGMLENFRDNMNQNIAYAAYRFRIVNHRLVAERR